MRFNKKGFTLVELLAVLVVILSDVEIYILNTCGKIEDFDLLFYFVNMCKK